MEKTWRVPVEVSGSSVVPVNRPVCDLVVSPGSTVDGKLGNGGVGGLVGKGFLRSIIP